MYISLKDPGMDIKTLRSELSNIDIFSKLEAGFLEKFFKYNLTDYFHLNFANILEELADRKSRKHASDQHLCSKIEKHLASSLFMVAKRITVQEFEQNLQKFYAERSASVSKNELPFAFKLKYHNGMNPVPSLLNPGELVFVDVKIKAEVQKIEELPEKIIKHFESYRICKKGSLSPLEEMLSNYRQDHFNIFVVYFGDSNFQIFNKERYETQSIKLMGRHFKLRIFAFFISKQALIQTFKSVNKIENLDYINDLVIQFYELKREKQRRKRTRKTVLEQPKTQTQSINEKLYMFIGVCGLVGFGFALKKLFL